MDKIWLIIQREILNRIQKKSFLITTILVPLIFPAIMAVLIFIMLKEIESAGPDTVLVVDESGRCQLDSTRRFRFIPINLPLEEAKKVYQHSENFALLYIPDFNLDKPEGFVLYTRENPSIEKIEALRKVLKDRIHDLKLEAYHIDKEVLKKLKDDISLQQFNLTETGEEQSSNSGILYAAGFLLGILIYMFVMIYGIQIMQGVIDEKSSRIVEVIVSSVKPFQLMLGKIIGIASVGLLQFLIWIVLISVLSSAVFAYFGMDMPRQELMEQISVQAGNEEMQQAMQSHNPQVFKLVQQVNQLPFGKITLVFMFYFLGGYLLYGALFAAVGSAVDSIQDSQQFQFPLTLPLLIGYIGLFMFILRDPHGPVSFWLSVIPFTSPVAMVGRITFGVPDWQLALSMTLLVAGFIFTTWVAARIYRIGILMTGTKVNYKVLARWFMMKG